MNAAGFTAIAFSGHEICNPLSFSTLGRVLDQAAPAPGDVAFDLGCGTGAAAAWLARRYRVRVRAVERDPGMAALARARLGDDASTPGEVEVIEAEAAAFLAEAGPARLILALGASDLFAGDGGPAAGLTRLRASLASGGKVLWGDPFWIRPPTGRIAAIWGDAPYLGHAACVAAGEAAGLIPLYAAVSPEADWEDFFWRLNGAVEAWLAAHPDDPDAPAFRAHLAGYRAAFLEERAATMGFGLYLFGKP